MVKLKGISWNHKRGYEPLILCSKDFKNINPDIDIKWEKRSLKEFGNFPVSKLAENYDLLIIDHPFSGEAKKKEILVDLKEYIKKDVLKELQINSIGKTYDSYCFEDSVIALPIDAAAIVCSANKEFFHENKIKLPVSLNEVFDLKEKLNFLDKKILIPLCSTDIWCVFLSLCATVSDGNFITIENGFDEKYAVEQVNMIKKLIKISDNNPLELNPINILDLMGSDDKYVYSPLLFGYVNYSIKGEYRNLINFYDTPLVKRGKTAALLGGAGIAISTKSRNKKEAAKFVEYISSKEVQESSYFVYGGQPSHKAAWKNRKNNEISNNFFKNTYCTLEDAYVRPRFPGWNDYQDEASVLLHKDISNNIDSERIVKNLNDLFFKHFRINA